MAGVKTTGKHKRLERTPQGDTVNGKISTERFETDRLTDKTAKEK